MTHLHKQLEPTSLTRFCQPRREHRNRLIDAKEEHETSLAVTERASQITLKAPEYTNLNHHDGIFVFPILAC